MTKKKSESKKPVTPLSSSATVASKRLPSLLVPSDLAFPELYPKNNLECRAILDDQILVIDVRVQCSLHIGLHVDPRCIYVMQDFFSATECKAFAKFIDKLPLELTPPKKRGEAERVNRKFGRYFIRSSTSLRNPSIFRTILSCLCGLCSETAHPTVTASPILPSSDIHEAILHTRQPTKASIVQFKYKSV